MIDIPRDREHVPFFPSRCAFFFLRVVRDKTWMRPWEMGGVRLYTHAGLHRAESHFLAKNAIQYGHGSLPPPSFVLHPFPERYPSPTLHSSIYKTFIVGRTLPGILLRRYRSDYFTWIFDLNLPTPLKFRLDPTQFSPRFSSFSLLFEREGGGEGFWKVESKGWIISRSTEPLSTFHDDFFFTISYHGFIHFSLQKKTASTSRKLRLNVPWKYLVLKKGGWCRGWASGELPSFSGKHF